MNIEIKFDFEELPGDGDVCTFCGEIISGKKYVPYVQIGDPKEVAYFDTILCEKCYLSPDDFQ